MFIDEFITTNTPVKEKQNLWNFLVPFIFFFAIAGALVVAIFNTQIIQYQELLAKSQNNSINTRYIYPDRGVIYDRNGVILAQNNPAIDIYLNITDYRTEEGELDSPRIEKLASELEKILENVWSDSGKYTSLTAKVNDQYSYMILYPDLYKLSSQGAWNEANADEINRFLSKNITERWQKLVEINGEELAFKIIWRELEDMYYQKEVVIAKNINNEQSIKIKSLQESYNGIRLDESSKRFYPYGESMAHILGYVGVVNFEDWTELDYVGLNDYVGRLGVEKVYDKKLIGQKGILAYEVDAFGQQFSKEGRIVKESVTGDSLVLTIDIEAQNKMYEILASATEKYEAAGAVGILQDIETGEILTLASYPSYNSNDFIDGMSDDEYALLNDPIKTPLLNRAIAAQLPPGSTFKTLAAVAGLDSGAITQNTIYVSRSGYTFSNGAPFQDYRGNAYGALNVVSALGKSSNIFFCEMIRNWDIDEYIPYLDDFGIGKTTEIDLIGEAPGRLPSPENKIELANLPGVTWLDPIWYPEGDGCNTVIGQGIALATPIQMVNWISAIANDGTLNTPHLAKEFTNISENKTAVNFSPLAENLASSSALSLVRQGMHASAADSFAARGNKADFAQKTGTAEFGKLNEKGVYENTHAWVTGFFPYKQPKYAFVILLEDGGESYNATFVAKEFTDWWVTRDDAE